jgi:hypothetical protein
MLRLSDDTRQMDRWRDRFGVSEEAEGIDRRMFVDCVFVFLFSFSREVFKILPL